MRSETIAIHSGYDIDPTTKAVAVPIYQTVAYAFDSAEHGAALFNLEVEGYRYTRISNPTNEVLERRGAAPRGGGQDLRAGRVALCGAQSRRERKEHRLRAAALRHHLYAVCSPPAGIRHQRSIRRERPSRGHREAHGWGHASGVLRERGKSGGQHLRYRSAGEGRPPARRTVDRGQHGRYADSAAPVRVRGRHRAALADEIHGWPRHD